MRGRGAVGPEPVSSEVNTNVDSSVPEATDGVKDEEALGESTVDQKKDETDESHE